MPNMVLGSAIGPRDLKIAMHSYYGSCTHIMVLGATWAGSNLATPLSGCVRQKIVCVCVCLCLSTFRRKHHIKQNSLLATPLSGCVRQKIVFVCVCLCLSTSR